MKPALTTLMLLGGWTTACAQLSVAVGPVKVAGQKAVVSLGLSNGLPEKVQSARAAVFVLDERGKVVGQSTRWIIGGDPNKLGLASGATNVFHFVIPSDKPFPTTNLTAKVTVSRLVLEGGKSADVNRDVKVEQGGR
jgi:hypothetical protein